MQARQCLIRPGDRIAVEQKGYPPAWRLFESLGAKLVPIPVDAEGLVTSELKSALQKKSVKMIYTTPLHQYPTTVTMSPRRRQELIALAEQFHIPILEDDYDHEFHYLGPPPAPLSAETNYGIYICSFSKILFPGARLGVIACDSEFHRHFAHQKFLVSRQTDCLSQLALAYWIEDGGFERHLRRMRRAYEKRYHVMLEQLAEIQKHTDIEFVAPNGGMSIWLDLKRDSKKIADRALKKGILFQHESNLVCGKKAGTHLRIGFAVVNEREIKDGLKTLAEVLAR